MADIRVRHADVVVGDERRKKRERMPVKDDCMYNLCHGDYNYVAFALVLSLSLLLPLSYNHHLILCEGQGYFFHLGVCVCVRKTEHFISRH
jgi:hypothetical protein